MKFFLNKVQLVLLIFCIGFVTCKPNEKVTKISAEHQLIIGKWILESAKTLGIELTPLQLGGDILMEFKKDGTGIFTTPKKIDRGQYILKDRKIYDPANLTETPLTILLLTKQRLVISMSFDGQEIEMRFIAIE